MIRWKLLMVCFSWLLCCSLAMADPASDAVARKRASEAQRILKSVHRLAPEKREEALTRLKELKEEGAPVVEMAVEMAAGTNATTQLIGLELIREFLPKRVDSVERLMKRPGPDLTPAKVFGEWSKAAEELTKDDQEAEVLFPLVGANLTYAWVVASDQRILNRESNGSWQGAVAKLRGFAIKIANRHPPAAATILKLATAEVSHLPGTFPPGLDERFRLRNDTIQSLAAFREFDPPLQRQAIAALQLMLRNTDDCERTQQTPASVAALTLSLFSRPAGK